MCINKGKLFTIASKHKIERQLLLFAIVAIVTIEREIKEISKEIEPEKKQKNKNDNFTKNNREKSNIVCRMIN